MEISVGRNETSPGLWVELIAKLSSGQLPAPRIDLITYDEGPKMINAQPARARGTCSRINNQITRE